MSDLAEVVFSLETYEERVAYRHSELELKKQQTIAKMLELGFTQEEIDAVTPDS